MNTNRSWLMADNNPGRFGLAFLIFLHIVICCVSLIYVANFEALNAFIPARFHIFFDPTRWYVAVIVVAGFALVSSAFVFALFSFGYFVGFYSYTMNPWLS